MQAIGSVLLGILVLVVVGVPLLIAAGVRFSVEQMRAPRFPRVEETEEDFAVIQEASGEEERWANCKGYEWLGVYRFQPLLVVAWWNRSEATYLCKYIHERRGFHDFVTTWGDDTSLTTGSSRDGLMLPQPPGWHVQAFENRSVDELYHLHQEGVAYLRRRLGSRPRPSSQEFTELILRKVRIQAEYVAAMPFYPLRGVIWYLVRRQSLVNRPITRQAA